MITRARAGIFKPKTFLSSSLAPLTELGNVTQALIVPTMTEEYEALLTRDLVPYSPHMNLITTKWIFRVKYKADGSVERYKARLVARGFSKMQELTTSILSLLSLDL